MKKILFLFAYPQKIEDVHLVHKFDGQIKGAEKLGLETWYTSFGDSEIFISNKENKIKIGKTINYPQNILQCHLIFKKIDQILKISTFDICYIRNLPAIPSYLSALKKLKKHGCKVVIEIPTYRKKPSKSENYNRLLYRITLPLLNFLFGRKVEKYVDLYTVIGDKTDLYRGVKAINITNSLDIDTYPVVNKNYKFNNEFHLIALAKMSYWHGYDRIIEGLKNYYSQYHSIDVFFHLVGDSDDGSLNNWRELAYKYHLNNYVIFEGYKSGIELDKLFDLIDVGIGSIGLYRKQLENESSIKEVEYCARGIPFIYSGNNELLDDNSPFFLKISNDDKPVDISLILNFYINLIKNFPDLDSQIRQYAEDNMRWEKELRKILDILN